MTRGYFRFGSDGTNVQDNLALLFKAGATSGNIFFDECGDQEFRRTLELCQEGDTLLVVRIMDVGDDVTDLFGVLRTLYNRKACLRSLAEPWFELSPATMRKGTLYTLIEQLYLLTLRMEGKPKKEAKIRRPVGRPFGSLPATVSKVELALKLYDEESDLSVSDLCHTVGLNERTFYRHLRKRHPQELTRRSKGRKSKD